MGTSGFKFLEEKPLQSAEELAHSKFGHEEISDTLVKIVRECPAPFTVGLFAKWGSGKSTVANSLKQKLPQENIPVVIFDVWKHEGDALRRTFLKETVRQLKEAGSEFFESNFVLDEKLEQSVSRSSESRFVFPKEKLLQLAWPLIIGITLVALSGFAADRLGYFDFYQYFLATLFGSATAGGLLLLLIKHALQLFSTETVNYGVDKFGDPHQFEEEFARVLSALKNPRVLIIFDNLDRVMHDKVAEVLSTIKTFLEPQDIANDKREVVFLVPSDAKAIKQHLSSVYNPADKVKNNHAFDPDEFLRKFFNTIVWIPDFIPSELEAFARSRLQETKVPLLDNDYVAWIITKAFRNNPRQIIQFTNILLANYLLVEEREGDDKDFPQGFLKENVPQLTKYLVLNQLFPEEMDILREEKVLDIDDVQQDSLQTDTKERFLAFVSETETIPISDLRTFFTLRRSEQEKKFPGFETFIAHLEDRNSDDAEKYLEQVGDLIKPETLGDFSQAIKEDLGSKSNPVSTVNLIHTLLEILDKKKTTLTPTLYEEVNNLLGGYCKKELHTIDPQLLNDAFLKKDDKYRKNVVSQWITVVEDVVSGNNKFKSDMEFVEGVASIFATNPSYLEQSQGNKVRELLATHLSSNIEIAKIMTQSADAEKTLGNVDFVRGFTEAIQNDGSKEEVIPRLEVLNAYSDALLSPVGGDVFVKKFSNLQEHENQNITPESYPEKAKLFDQFREFMRSHTAVLMKAKENVRDAFGDMANTGFNAQPDHQLRSVFVAFLFELRSFLTDAKREETERSISSWLGNVQTDSFEQTFALLSEEDQIAFLDLPVIYKAAASRAYSDQHFRDAWFPLLKDERKKQFLEGLLNTNVDTAFDFYDTLKGSDVKVAFTTFDSAWQKFDAGNPTQKQKLLKFVNKHKGNNDVSVREALAAKIITCLTTTDIALQEIGRETFEESTLSKELRRRVVKEVSDWIKKPEVAPKYQPHAINAIANGFDEFNQEEKNEFTHFIFDEIVRKSGKPAHITEALSVLASLKPKYEERQTNFNDIRARIEAEENPDLKRVLIEGMHNLKPARTSKENAEYWSWIDEEKGKLSSET